MRIKSLEIHGFKSFAEPARLNFGDGITGVVGPNGCGKSNIIDALRWCMGETSAKHLRGRAMQDVIFAGSTERGPSGMAEVTITFHNDGNVPLHMTDYEEIAVTRRLHRDGASEYRINGVAVRLRDITDLFLGTGVGPQAYSIIEQGRIGFVVSARPEDRRSLIEEVAGISKFKVRKQAAERRMGATEQNLARVSDIVAELERQLTSLKRQAKKAERYKRLKAEVRDFDIHFAAHELLRLLAHHKIVRADHGQSTDRVQALEHQLALLATQVETERLRLLEEESRLQHAQVESGERDTRVAELERDLGHWQVQIAEIKSQVEQALLEVEDAAHGHGSAANERQEIADELTTHLAFVAQEKGQLERASQVTESLSEGLNALDVEVERLRKEDLNCVHSLAGRRSEVSHGAEKQGQLTLQHKRVIADLEALNEERVLLKEEHQEISSQYQHRVERTKELTTSLAVVDVSIKDANSAFHESERALSDLREQHGERRSRLSSFEEIARQFEGYSDGVRTLMQEAGDGRAGNAFGLSKLVTDVISVTDAKYERAIETALGERLQYLLVEDHENGRQAIDFLRSKKGGRGGFVLSQPRQTTPERTLIELPDGLVPALHCVKSVKSVKSVNASSIEDGQPIIDALLGDLWIADDLDSALSVWEQEGFSGRIVTLAGDLLDAHGTLSGGSDEGAGLLAKKREIRQLRETVGVMEKLLIDAKVRHTELDEQRTTLSEQRTVLDQQLRAIELAQVETQKDIKVLDNDLARLAKNQERLQNEGSGLGEQLTQLVSKVEQAQADVDMWLQKHHAYEAELAQVLKKRSDRGSEIEGEMAALTTLKVRLASSDEKALACKMALKRLDEQILAAGVRKQRAEKLIVDNKQRRALLEEQYKAGVTNLQQLVAEAEQGRESLTKARERYDLERVSLIEQENTQRRLNKDREQALQGLMDLQLKLERNKLEREQVISVIYERHDFDLSVTFGDYHLRPLVTDANRAQRDKLLMTIKNIGPINLTAIDECAEVSQRFHFLVAQKEDLSQALETLRKAISRINRTSRERFREAFDAVNEMFQKIFPRLFRGGEARLELLPHEDILEAGVDIVAMPPGKKCQSVGLLSGGEKALTATALIFSIFLIKPSPFCVLDEVDAPLDDANVRRFNDLLHEMAQMAQFIVITHNKSTMTHTDRLYGITMEDPGMSKVVSVEFDSDEGSSQHNKEVAA